jgi:drug/metabolite transporter (DMT)-like permease
MKTPRFVFPIFLLGSAMLSAGPLFVRLADVSALSSAFWRMALAVPLLFAVALITDRGTPLLPRSGRLWLVLAGALFAADLSAWHFGIGRTSMANATMLGNSAAFLFPVWGYFVVRQWPTRAAALALCLAVIGIALLMGQSASISTGNLFGDLLCFTAAVFYTAYLVVMDRSRGALSAMGALAPATAAGAICLLPFALVAPGAFWPQDWVPVVLLALSSQVVGQGLVIFALPHLPPIASGVGLLSQPAIAALIGYIWYGEVLTPMDLAGVTLLFAAILIVRRPGAVQPPIK